MLIPVTGPASQLVQLSMHSFESTEHYTVCQLQECNPGIKNVVICSLALGGPHCCLVRFCE